MNTRQWIATGTLTLATMAFSALATADDLWVAGEVETQTGLRFPDGSLQTSAAAQGEYANVIFVAMVGGHFTRIQDAIDSITDASANNRYLVSVAPGTYSGSITTKPFVDLQGSGRKATRIGDTGLDATVSLGDNSEISSLRIICDRRGTSPVCIGLEVQDTPNGAVARDVDVSSYAPGGSSEGIKVGAARGSTSNLELRNVYVRSAAPNANGRAVAIRNGLSTTVNVFNSTLEVSGSPDVNDAIHINAGGELNAYNTIVNAFSGDDINRAVYVAPGGVGTFRYSRFFASGLKCFVIETQDDATVIIEHSSIRTSTSSCVGARFGILTQGDGSGLVVDVSHSSVDVSHSSIEAEGYTVFNSLNPSTAIFRFTYFNGGPVIGGANTCLFASEETFDTTLNASTCP